MTRRALFFDRDDTLVRDSGYMHRPEDLVWAHGAIAAVKAANDAGWLVVIVTNQSGIGRGLFTLAQMHAFHAAMRRALTANGARIDALYYCPYHADATIPEYRVPDHPDRKPNPGMLLRAIRDFALDPAACALIGDQESDMEAARRAGVAPYKTQGGDILAIVSDVLARTGAEAR